MVVICFCPAHELQYTGNETAPSVSVNICDGRFQTENIIENMPECTNSQPNVAHWESQTEQVHEML